MPVSGSITESRSRLLVKTLFTLAAALVFALLSLRGFFDGLSGAVFLVIFFGMLFPMLRSKEEPDLPSDSHTRYPPVLTVAGLVMVFLVPTCSCNGDFSGISFNNQIIS